MGNLLSLLSFDWEEGPCCGVACPQQAVTRVDSYIDSLFRDAEIKVGMISCKRVVVDAACGWRLAQTCSLDFQVVQ